MVPQLRTAVFLDRDHVMQAAQDILDAPDGAGIAAFLAPEQVDARRLAMIGRGLRAADGWRTVQWDGKSALPVDSDAIIFRRGHIDRGTFASCPDLKLIQRLGVKSDGIDFNAAAATRVHVRRQPRHSLIMVAEHVMMFMLASAKRLFVADNMVRSNCGAALPGTVAYNWAEMTGVDGVFGKTLGIIGMGEVGNLVAQRALSFGMRVLYFSRRASAVADARGAERVDLEALLSQADFVSLHLQGSAENIGFMDPRKFGLMREGAYLINTSRGALVDEVALLEVLQSGGLAGAALDVHLSEPRACEDPLIRAPGVILTPHISAGGRSVLLREIEAIFDNLRAIAAGENPPNGLVGDADC